MGRGFSRISIQDLPLETSAEIRAFYARPRAADADGELIQGEECLRIVVGDLLVLLRGNAALVF
jgi:hypothetical protein